MQLTNMVRDFLKTFLNIQIMKKPFLTIVTVLLFLFISCEKDDEVDKMITLTSAEITLYPNEEHQIEATSNTTITYFSENNYHASVTELGLVTAEFVGETIIVLSNDNDTKKVQITVKPKNNLYPEPNLEFGISRTALIEKYGVPDAETEAGIAYDNYSNAAPIVMYFFDENNKLEITSVMVKTQFSSSLGTFLSERYLPIDSENFIFINSLELENTTMLIGADLYNLSYWRVLYAPYSSSTKSSEKSANSFEKEINNLFLQFENRE